MAEEKGARPTHLINNRNGIRRCRQSGWKKTPEWSSSERTIGKGGGKPHLKTKSELHVRVHLLERKKQKKKRKKKIWVVELKGLKKTGRGFHRDSRTQ